ncbi:MAG TPA: type II and III secretion system protein family protein [Caulobacteraceae bacterium]|nr:type II and III secretion system protein family protein [Caulobacteraceae bacterium]
MKSPTFAIAAVTLAAAALAQTASPALAQGWADAPAASSQPSVLHVDLAAASEGVRSISIPRGKSAIVDLPVDARDVLVTNPQVADAVLRTPRRIYVMGVAPGMTDAAFFDAAGRRILALNIRVDQDFSAVSQTINRLIPGAQVHVESANTSIVLSGEVASLSDADKAVQIAQQFTTKPEQVVNLLSIAGKEQVMLKVRIVEMQRSVIKQLGFNLNALMGQLGSPQFLLDSAAQYAVNGSFLGAFSAGSSLNTTQQPEVTVTPTTGVPYPIVCPTCTNGGPTNRTISTIQTTAGSTSLNRAGSTIQAFEQVGLVRTLAEPNLTAVSGESANFLAGGEFPVPTGEDQTGRVSIDFKPYGVGLGFTPVVLSGGRISLKISTEVSQLSNQGEFTLQTGTTTTSSGATAVESLTIPSLTVRRAETTVELPSGGAMMIAGLLQEQTKEDISSVPGLMNLPVLGALFRSRDYQEGETELVVIVTPYLVKPTSPASLQTPADGLKIADDAQTDLMGEINKAYKLKPDTTQKQTYQGPVGYVIE